MTLESFNTQEPQAASEAMARCCTATRWVNSLVEGRPYPSVEDIISRAETVWAAMAETDWLEAFEGHPKIGDPDSLREKYRATLSTASSEQSAVHQADSSTLNELARLNQEYLRRFGFIFITFASGRGADDILSELKTRIVRSRSEELEFAAAEQWKITRQRLQNLLTE